MIWHMAEVWEAAADAVPDAPALIHGEVQRTWRQYEDRAARIAAALTAAGHGPGSNLGLYAYNSSEYLEAQFAVLKIKGGPINVNYRYTETELIYLLDNSDAVALVFDAQFAPRVEAIRAHLPNLKTFIEIEDGSGLHLTGAHRFEDLMTAYEPLPRQVYSEDEIYMLYTGGTTGMPKGVMYRQGDFTFSQTISRYDLLGLQRPTTRDQFVASIQELHASGQARIGLPACPVMHGTGLWIGVFAAHFTGGCAVTFRNDRFDAHELWRLVERRRVSFIAIVGDAFARPMLNALEAAQAADRPFDLSALQQIISSGVMFSKEVKEGLLKFGDFAIVDIMGSTEGGMASSSVSREAPPGETAKFVSNPTTKVFGENDKEVAPGSEVIGMVANGGLTPVGYYKDPEKSARTFRVIDGHRYSFPGDFAKIAADGSLILLGRGSNCINTGGEKVYPEEVEEAIKAHPAVADCLVVGLPDERFGQRIVAVLSLVEGADCDETDILTFVRGRIAGYKVPRSLVIADLVQRAANGKADYGWARSIAETAASQDRSG